MKVYSYKYKILLKPIIIFTVVVILFITSVSLSYKNTQSFFAKIDEAKASRLLLEERVAVLRDSQPDLETNIAQTAVGVLPSENPSLLVVSQIRKLASENQVSLDNVNLNARQIEGEEFPSVEISFKATGSYAGVSTLIDLLSSYSPLMNLTQLKMTEVRSEVEADVSVKSYWAAFPKELPAITEQISGLSEDERILMDELSNFKQAEVTDVSSLSPEEVIERSDPFSLDL